MNSTLIHSQNGRLTHWAYYFREQFSLLIAAMALPIMLVSEPMQVDTSLPSETEVIWEMSFLKRHKAAESDGLSSSFFKDGWRQRVDIGVSKTAGINLGKGRDS